MKVIYSSVLCSPEKFNSVFEGSFKIPGQQVQKYHRLIVEGLSANNIEVETISALPISRNTHNRMYFRKENEKNERINYNYLPVLNIPIVKNLFIFIAGFYESFKQLRKSKNSYVVGDVLNISVATSSLLASKILRRKSIGIITDVPGYLAMDNKNKENISKKIKNEIVVKINSFMMNRFDSYIFLTEQTNELVNKRNKPYIVLEGQVDTHMESNYNSIEDKYERKVIIYTGALKKIYGLQMLTEAFIKADIEGSELHIYGSGSFEKELEIICKKQNNIKYFGVQPNNIVVKEQIKATLLVNPRPTKEEYTKYSFPSKNMEYMVSGTPTLTTLLPGMPEEYNNYIYKIENETADGLAQTLKNILSKPQDELHEKGLQAKEFVLREKSNVIQAKKILNMINNNLKK